MYNVFNHGGDGGVVAMKLKYIITIFLAFCVDVFAAIDQRVDILNNYQSFEQRYPNLIFAGASGLQYKCYNGSSLNFSRIKEGSFQWMLDLKYDLDLATNQMNWVACETLAAELMETVGGKYGLSAVAPKETRQNADKLFNFQNMAVLQAAMVINQVAIQRKTTQIMKVTPNINPTQTERVNQKDLLIEKIQPKYTLNNVLGIMELAKVLSHPDHAESIAQEAWRKYEAGKYINDEQAYKDATKEYLEKTFNLGNDATLNFLASEYFNLLYKKAAKVMRYSEEKIKLKLADFNGYDSDGVKNMCTWRALLGPIEHAGNESFSSKKQIMTMEELREANTTRTIIYDGYKDRPVVIDGKNYLQSKENGENIETKVIPYTKFDIQGKVLRTSNQKDGFHQQKECTFLQPLGDVSSNRRACLACVIWIANMNNNIQNSRLLKIKKEIDNQVNDLYKKGIQTRPTSYPATVSVTQSIVHTEYNVHVDGRKEIKKQWIEQKPYTVTIKNQFTGSDLNPLILLCRHNSNLSNANDFYNSENKYLQMFAAHGLGLAEFYTGGPSWTNWPSKRFFNEYTIIENEGAFQTLQLEIACIFGPFTAIAGQAGLNEHARWITQYE